MSFDVTSPTGWVELDGEGFFGLLGPVFYLPVAEGVARFRFDATAKHRNRSNVVHGGMLMAFADRALGTTAKSPERAMVTVQLDMHFIAAAKIGATVEMECHLLSETRSLIFLDGVMESEGLVVATAKGIWKKIRRHVVG